MLHLLSSVHSFHYRSDNKKHRVLAVFFVYGIIWNMKVHKLEKPQKTFFFERQDGSIISVGEQEAWNLHARKNQVIGQDIPKPKLIGVSDGMKVHQAIKEAHEIFRTDSEAAQERVRRGHDEELEAARGHIILPRNFDKMGDGADFI